MPSVNSDLDHHHTLLKVTCYHTPNAMLAPISYHCWLPSSFLSITFNRPYFNLQTSILPIDSCLFPLLIDTAMIHDTLVVLTLLCWLRYVYSFYLTPMDYYFTYHCRIWLPLGTYTNSVVLTLLCQLRIWLPLSSVSAWLNSDTQ